MISKRLATMAILLFLSGSLMASERAPEIPVRPMYVAQGAADVDALVKKALADAKNSVRLQPPS